MKNEQESIFAPYLNTFVSQRVEQLTSEAEKLPAYKQSRESIKDQLSKAASAIGAEDLDTLISAIRGTNIAIFEHIVLNHRSPSTIHSFSVPINSLPSIPFFTDNRILPKKPHLSSGSLSRASLITCLYHSGVL